MLVSWRQKNRRYPMGPSLGWAILSSPFLAAVES
jgi:hypothetical protein